LVRDKACHADSIGTFAIDDETVGSDFRLRLIVSRFSSKAVLKVLEKMENNDEGKLMKASAKRFLSIH
jgi:hypothetical protein